MSPRFRVVFLLLATAAVAACARGPDTAGLQRDVQAQLDTLFGSRMVEVKSLRRQGSAPLLGAKDDAARAIVYYNAVLAFAAPYDPSDWTSLSPELIANALGATDEGVIGFSADGMATGTELRAYGSMVYRRTNDGWVASLLPPAPTRSAPGPAISRKSTELIEQLASIVNTTPGLHAADDAIVAEELDQALQDIRLRLDRGGQSVVIASGPTGGEYMRFVESLHVRGAPWTVTPAKSLGSVANALMLDSGEARFALVQSDVAAAAVTGQGAFVTHGPLRHLRALTALFPEPVHVVVTRQSSLRSVADLRGKRVAVGSRGSGTRQMAIQVLRAHGLDHDDYVIVDTRNPEESLQLLAANRIDAVVEVISAPWRQLAVVGADVPMKLLPLDAAVTTGLSASVPGLVPLDIPERTYAWQEGRVSTLAATALLVASATVPDASVQKLLESLFDSDLAADRGVSASRLSRERALLGVTIPLHDGAAEYFARTKASGVTPTTATP